MQFLIYYLFHFPFFLISSFILIIIVTIMLHHCCLSHAFFFGNTYMRPTEEEEQVWLLTQLPDQASTLGQSLQSCLKADTWLDTKLVTNWVQLYLLEGLDLYL